MFHFKSVLNWLLIYTLLATTLNAAEYIERYDVDITVNKDRSIDVIETIKVNSAGDRIRHGITRSYPTTRDRDAIKTFIGLRKKHGFYVSSITLDGKPINYEKLAAYRNSNSTARGLRFNPDHSSGYLLKIGSADHLITPGIHTFVISYRSTHQIEHFSSKELGSWDELYYNVLGNDTQFMVYSASCTIHLPKDIPSSFIEAKALEGKIGQSAKELQTHLNSDNTLTFSSNTFLIPLEGITAIVSFPAGFIPQPSIVEKSIRLIRDNIILIALILLSFVSFYILIITRRRYSRKRTIGIIIPLFERPQGISADQARLLSTKEIDNKAYTARIIQLAVDGYITIDWENNIHILRRTEKTTSNITDLNVLKSIFYNSNECAMKPYSTRMQDVTNTIKDELLKNKDVWLKTPGLSKAILLGFILVSIFMLSFFTDDSSISLAELLLYLVNALYIFFTASYVSYTDEGKKPAEETLGLGMYLNFTEKERLKYTLDTKLSPSTYEHLLPYAIALDAEEAWHQQFKSIFESLERQGTPYQPLWYRGRSFNYYTFSNSFNSNLNSSIASAQRATGSSSGRSGGSVGGGGGGGGVGGW